MKNFVKKGDSLPTPIAADVASGEVVVAGSLVGIAQVDGLNGDTIEVAYEGVVELPREATDTFAFGEAVYWDGSVVTTTDTSNTLMGYAAQAVAVAAAGSIQVKLGR